MRISDWSSDVCSSDLVAVVDRRQIHDVGGQPRQPDLPGADQELGETASGQDHQARSDRRNGRRAGQARDAADALHEPAGRGRDGAQSGIGERHRSEEHTSELQSLMRISYAVLCLKNKKDTTIIYNDVRTQYRNV